MYRSGSFITLMSFVSLLLICVAPLQAAAAVTGGEAGMVSRIVEQYFAVSEISTKVECAGGNCGGTLECEYAKAVGELCSLQKDLSSAIVAGMNKGDHAPLKNFSAAYNERSAAERLPLYPVCAAAIENFRTGLMNGKTAAAASLGVISEENFASEYFPGYGYAEPGYRYRKGRELDSEFLNAYWQDEEKIIETAVHFQGNIEVGAAAELRASPHVTNFTELSAPFKMNVGGHVIFAVAASFDSRTRLTTVARKKYASTKVWFELHRRKNFGGEWELCGKTFEMRDIYTNEEVISGVKYEK